MKSPKYSILLASLAVASATAHGAITYVDASTANTTLADGSAFTPGGNTTDDNWGERAFANGGTIFSTNDSGGEDGPTLSTTISGLIAGQAYNVTAYFWGSDGALWRGRAALSNDGGTLPLYNTSHFAGSTGIPMTEIADGDGGDNPLNPGPVTTADGSGIENGGYFTNSVLTFEDDRFLTEAGLGTATANGDGEIEIFIDDLQDTNNGNRTWYDGVGFEVVPEPSSALLGGLGLLAFLRRRR